MFVLTTVAWVITALGGLVIASIWHRAVVQRDRTRSGPLVREDGAITTGLVSPHATLAVTGLLFWILAAFAPDGEPGTAGRVIALALLVVAMSIGVAMVRMWRTARQSSGPDAAVPGAVVAAHGLRP